MPGNFLDKPGGMSRTFKGQRITDLSSSAKREI
jgi:hypothetical protein